MVVWRKGCLTSVTFSFWYFEYNKLIHWSYWSTVLIPSVLLRISPYRRSRTRFFTNDYCKVLLTIAIIINSLDYLGWCDGIVETVTSLGKPPTEFSTNDVEAANFMVKYGLHFDPQKPHVFIESVKDIIETKYSNDDIAVMQ